jgi:hypothetical protein
MDANLPPTRNPCKKYYPTKITFGFAEVPKHCGYVETLYAYYISIIH